MTPAATSTDSSELRAHAHALFQMGRDMLARAYSLESKGRSKPSFGMEAEILTLAKAAQDDRARRSDFFRASLFGEPGWDMLLDIFIQERVGKPTSVMDAHIGSGASTGTAHRYLKLLVEDGLIEREGDPKDSRRSWLKLTSNAREAMVEYLKSATFLGRSGLALEIGKRD